MQFRFLCPLLLLLHCSFFKQVFAQSSLSKLVISDNQRFLTKEDGAPFVWIGDTQWFFAKLPPDILEKILDARKSQGFTIMQVSCREQLYNGTGPGTVDRPNEAWWSYLDWYIDACAHRNLYVGITLGWWQKAFKLDEDTLFKFGQWVGHRYRAKSNIVWMTLGEAGGHSRKRKIPIGKMRALVNGIRAGDTGNKLLTIHADYKRGSSLEAEHAALSDFNNWQTSQWCCPRDLPRKDDRNWTVWQAIEYDYIQKYEGQPKPTIDAEAWYEHNKDFCGVTPFQLRRRAYFTILAGAFGHTYGAGGIWDGLLESDSCSRTASEALMYPGVTSISHVSTLFHSLGSNFLKLSPGQSLVFEGNSSNYEYHIQAARSKSNNFALFYSASDQPYKVDFSGLSDSVRHIAWYNPRSGKYSIGEELAFSNKTRIVTLDPPGENGTGSDWVLLVGDDEFFSQLHGK